MSMHTPHRGSILNARRGVSALALAIACGWGSVATAGPDGGVVSLGAADIARAGKLTAVRQSTDRVIIDWTSFDVKADEVVRFDQPSAKSVALNRVAAGSASRIDGAVQANGNVWLVNPSGVMFGNGSRVDVGGLIVSTADISNENFAAGRMVFDRPGDPGASIVNDGDITFAEAGLAGFVAPEVLNRGRIAGKLGRITIAGKDGFSVDISGDGMFEIDLADAAPAANARLVNEGALIAMGGMVVIDAASARDALDGTVSAGGVISAASANVDGGKIILSGGSVTVTGALDASSATANGGVIAAAGDVVHLAATARVDASGRGTGGLVRIGAAAPGTSPLPARRTLVSAGAEVRANGGAIGGDILVWSDQVTAMRGALSATGEVGGRIEASSAIALAFDGSADASGGLADGLVLLDPTFLVIGSDGTDNAEFADNQILSDDGGPASTFYISAATLGAISGSLTLQASDTLTVNQTLTFTGGDLSLEAGRDIVLNADVSALGALAVRANATVAGAPGVTDGSIVIDASRSLIAGGALTLSTGTTGTLDGSAMALGDTLRLEAGGAIAASALTLAGDLSAESLGTMSFNKRMVLAGDVDLTSNGGAITFASLTGSVAGGVTLDARGTGAAAGNVTVQLAGRLTLDALHALNASVLAFGGIDAPGAVSLLGTGTFQTNSTAITMTNAANSFAGEVKLLGVTVAGAAVGDVAFRSSGAVTLSQLVAGDASVQAGGAITQTGAATVTGGAAFISSGAITLTAGANAFGGPVALTGGAAAVTTPGALTLGAMDVASLSITAGGAVGQSAAGHVAGALTLRTSGDAVTLAAAGNRFDGPVSALTDDGGAPVASVDLRADGSLRVASIRAQDVTLRAGGAVSQTVAMAAAGSVDIASTGGITLSRNNVIGGDLTMSTEARNVVVDSIGGTVGGDISIDTRDGAGVVAAVSVRQGGVARLGDVHADTLTVLGVGGIDASGALLVAGDASFQTRSRAITLRNAANSFGGTVDLIGLTSQPSIAGDATLRATGDVTLGVVIVGALDLETTGSIAQTGRVNLSSASRFAAGGDIALTAADNGFGGAVALSGADVRIAAAGALTLAAADAADLTVTAGGALAQIAAAQVAGALTLSVDGDVTLDRADNEFAMIAGAARGASARLRDADGFAFDNFTGGQVTVGAAADRQAGDVTLSGRFGDGSAIAVAGAIVLDAAGVQIGDAATLDAVGAITGAGALTLGAGAQLIAGAQVKVAALSATDVAVSAQSIELGTALVTDRFDATAAGAARIDDLVAAEASLAGDSLAVGRARIDGALAMTAAGALDLGDEALANGSAAGSATLTAGGAMSVSALSVSDALSIIADQGLVLTEVAADGDVMADVATGDIDVSGLTVGGDFGAHAADGGIFAQAAAGQTAPVIAVAGATRLDASGVIALAAQDAAPRHSFGGALSVTRATQVVIAAEGDLTLGATDIAFASIGAEGAGGVFDRTGPAIDGSVRLEAGGAIVGQGGATLLADGDLRLEAGGAILLTDANRIGGAVSVRAASLGWAELGSILLADVTVGGDTALIAGMDGGLGNGAIRQGGVATALPARLVEGLPNLTPETFSGPMRIAGALTLRTSGDAVTLAAAGNRFDGPVSALTDDGGAPVASVD
ncbi:MAG: filamentous hemagglutinin family protein, partial [Paracoccaceae bacterium]